MQDKRKREKGMHIIQYTYYTVYTIHSTHHSFIHSLNLSYFTDICQCLWLQLKIEKENHSFLVPRSTMLKYIFAIHSPIHSN